MAEQTYRKVDKFDRMMGSLEGLPDVTRTKPSTIVAASPMIGETQTFIIQTFRQRERGDTIFLQYVDGEGSVRLFIPPAAADAIARQRDAIGMKIKRAVGRRVGKEQAALRKARGEKPAFMIRKKKIKEDSCSS